MSDNSKSVSFAPRWIGGAILIFIGLIFLLQNAGFMSRDGNWWAVFIYIPAFILLSSAYTSYRASGDGVDSGTLIQAGLGLFLTGLATVFLLDVNLNVNWDLVWPVILVFVGLMLLLRRK